MMKDAVKAIVDDGLEQLEEKLEMLKGAQDRAKAIYERCKSEIAQMRALNDAASPVFIDKFSMVFVGETGYMRDNKEHLHSAYLNLNGSTDRLTRVLGTDELQGKYRFLVLLEKVE